MNRKQAGRKPVCRRFGAGLFGRVCLGELVAATPEEYVTIATQLAEAPRRLADLRSSLRSRLSSSPLCDAPGFTQALETAYRRMGRRWCETASPQGLKTD